MAYEKMSSFELESAKNGNIEKKLLQIPMFDHIFNVLNSCLPVGGVPIIRKKGWMFSFLMMMILETFQR